MFLSAAKDPPEDGVRTSQFFELRESTAHGFVSQTFAHPESMVNSYAKGRDESGK